jgi:hypothetical protein
MGGNSRAYTRGTVVLHLGLELSEKVRAAAHIAGVPLSAYGRELFAEHIANLDAKGVRQ